MFHLVDTIWRLRLYAVHVFPCYLLNTGQRATYDERHIRYRVTYTGLFHKTITILSCHFSSYVYGFASTNNPDHPRSFSKNKEFENVSPS